MATKPLTVRHQPPEILGRKNHRSSTARGRTAQSQTEYLSVTPRAAGGYMCRASKPNDHYSRGCPVERHADRRIRYPRILPKRLWLSHKIHPSPPTHHATVRCCFHPDTICSILDVCLFIFRLEYHTPGYLIFFVLFCFFLIKICSIPCRYLGVSAPGILQISPLTRGIPHAQPTQQGVGRGCRSCRARFGKDRTTTSSCALEETLATPSDICHIRVGR